MSGRFSASKIETPERTFWVIEVDGTRILPPWGWGTADSEAEAETAVTRLETAYLLGVRTGREEIEDLVAREAQEALMRARGDE